MSIVNVSFEFKTFNTFCALDSFGQYWAATEDLIQKAAHEAVEKGKPTWVPKNKEEEGEYIWEWTMPRELHDQILIPMHRYSCIVTLYAAFERELRRAVENLEDERGKQKLSVTDIRGKSYLAQVGKFVEIFIGPKISDSPHYRHLCDLQKIRDCIIHCRGEVRLSRDKDYLLNLKGKLPGFHPWNGTDLGVDAELIGYFIREVWNFFVWLFRELNWKIDDSWQKSKWLQLEKA